MFKRTQNHCRTVTAEDLERDAATLATRFSVNPYTRILLRGEPLFSVAPSRSWQKPRFQPRNGVGRDTYRHAFGPKSWQITPRQRDIEARNDRRWHLLALAAYLIREAAA